MAKDKDKDKEEEKDTERWYSWVRCTWCGGSGYRMTDWNRASGCPYCIKGYVRTFTG